MYDADGRILRVFVIHNGCIDINLQKAYSDKFGFVQTQDGCIDYKCMDEAMKKVYMYVSM